MRKQNENCLYNHKIKMIQDIKSMIIYIEQSVMRMIVQYTSQKKKRNITQNQSHHIIKKKKQDEQFEMQKNQE